MGIIRQWQEVLKNKAIACVRRMSRQPPLYLPTDNSDGDPTSTMATHEKLHAHKHELHPFPRHLKKEEMYPAS